MFRFRIVFSILSIIGLWSLQACKTFSIPAAAVVSEAPDLVENLYFASSEDLVYKTHLQIYSKQMSGLVHIKRISDTAHRIAFTTDFGNKLLDFEISTNSFTPHYLTSDMDKKAVRNVLEEDFRTLLQSPFYPHTAWQTSAEQIFMAQKGKVKTYFYFQEPDKKLTQIIHTVNNKEKVQYVFKASSSTLADSVYILHKDIKLQINFYHLPNSNSE